MFKVYLYGYSSSGFGYLDTMDIQNIDYERLSSDRVAVVVVEDKITSFKRYIFGVNTRAELIRNEILKGFYKAVTFHGGEGKKNWTQIISHCDAEIFCTSLEHIQEIIEMLRQSCAEGKAFWYMYNCVKDYVAKKNIDCYTEYFSE